MLNNYPRFSKRVFFLSPLYASSGWYFRIRGGKSLGPYFRKEDAIQAAADYAGECNNNRNPGGRDG